VESNVDGAAGQQLRSNCNLSSRRCAAGRCALSGTCNCSRTARAEAVGSQLWLSEDWEAKQAAARQRRTEQSRITAPNSAPMIYPRIIGCIS
jgi:hypothetical protein